MSERHIEIFSAGCPACADTIDLVNDTICGSCSVEVLDMSDAEVAGRARNLGIRSVPAVVVDGKLLDCCAGGVDKASLLAAGVGRPTT